MEAPVRVANRAPERAAGRSAPTVRRELDDGTADRAASSIDHDPRRLRSRFQQHGHRPGPGADLDADRAGPSPACEAHVQVGLARRQVVEDPRRPCSSATAPAPVKAVRSPFERSRLEGLERDSGSQQSKLHTVCAPQSQHGQAGSPSRSEDRPRPSSVRRARGDLERQLGRQHGTRQPGLVAHGGDQQVRGEFGVPRGGQHGHPNSSRRLPVRIEHLHDGLRLARQAHQTMARRSVGSRHQRTAHGVASIRPKQVVAGAACKQLDRDRGPVRAVLAPDLERTATVSRSPTQVQRGRSGLPVVFDLEALQDGAAFPHQFLRGISRRRDAGSMQATRSHQAVAFVQRHHVGRLPIVVQLDAAIGKRRQRTSGALARDECASARIQARDRHTQAPALRRRRRQ